MYFIMFTVLSYTTYFLRVKVIIWEAINPSHHKVWLDCQNYISLYLLKL